MVITLMHWPPRWRSNCTGSRTSLSASAPNAGAEVGYGRKGKGTTIMLMVDGEGIPLSAFTTSATTSEVHAIETLGDERVYDKAPQRLLYDKAADADWLRDVRGIALICPHRRSRTKPEQFTAICGDLASGRREPADGLPSGFEGG